MGSVYSTYAFDMYTNNANAYIYDPVEGYRNDNAPENFTKHWICVAYSAQYDVCELHGKGFHFYDLQTARSLEGSLTLLRSSYLGR